MYYSELFAENQSLNDTFSWLIWELLKAVDIKRGRNREGKHHLVNYVQYAFLLGKCLWLF